MKLLIWPGRGGARHAVFLTSPQVMLRLWSQDHTGSNRDVGQEGEGEGGRWEGVYRNAIPVERERERRKLGRGDRLQYSSKEGQLAGERPSSHQESPQAPASPQDIRGRTAVGGQQPSGSVVVARAKEQI